MKNNTHQALTQSSQQGEYGMMITTAMIFGDLGGLKFPDICLTGEENPEKTAPRKLVPTGNQTRARYVTGARATASSTAVDFITYIC